MIHMDPGPCEYKNWHIPPGTTDCTPIHAVASIGSQAAQSEDTADKRSVVLTWARVQLFAWQASAASDCMYGPFMRCMVEFEYGHTVKS